MIDFNSHKNKKQNNKKQSKTNKQNNTFEKN
jgi:hypothetical protein